MNKVKNPMGVSFLDHSLHTKYGFVCLLVTKVKFDTAVGKFFFTNGVLTSIYIIQSPKSSRQDHFTWYNCKIVTL